MLHKNIIPLITPEQLNSLIDVQLDGIDHSDYPDFTDAYIDSACFPDGTELSPEQLDYIQENYHQWLYEKVIDWIF